MAAKPFSREYVLNITRAHVLKAVDTSLEKTARRLAELEGTPEGVEAMFVLNDLSKIRVAVCEAFVESK